MLMVSLVLVSKSRLMLYLGAGLHIGCNTGGRSARQICLRPCFQRLRQLSEEDAHAHSEHRGSINNLLDTLRSAKASSQRPVVPTLSKEADNCNVNYK